MKRTYTIKPRATNLGGGWHLRFYKDDVEVGGRVFPLAEYDDSETAKAAAEQEGKSFILVRP